MINISIKIIPFGDNNSQSLNPEIDDFTLYAFHNDQNIAHLSCYHEHGRLYAFEVNVAEEFRRQGVATHLYDHASQISGKTINSHKDNPYNESPEISQDAEAFWANRSK